MLFRFLHERSSLNTLLPLKPSQGSQQSILADAGAENKPVPAAASTPNQCTPAAGQGKAAGAPPPERMWRQGKMEAELSRMRERLQSLQATFQAQQAKQSPWKPRVGPGLQLQVSPRTHAQQDQQDSAVTAGTKRLKEDHQPLRSQAPDKQQQVSQPQGGQPDTKEQDGQLDSKAAGAASDMLKRTPAAVVGAIKTSVNTSSTTTVMHAPPPLPAGPIPVQALMRLTPNTPGTPPGSTALTSSATPLANAVQLDAQDISKVSLSTATIVSTATSSVLTDPSPSTITVNALVSSSTITVGDQPTAPEMSPTPGNKVSTLLISSTVSSSSSSSSQIIAATQPKQDDHVATTGPAPFTFTAALLPVEASPEVTHKAVAHQHDDANSIVVDPASASVVSSKATAADEQPAKPEHQAPVSSPPPSAAQAAHPKQMPPAQVHPSLGPEQSPSPAASPDDNPSMLLSLLSATPSPAPVAWPGWAVADTPATASPPTPSLAVAPAAVHMASIMMMRDNPCFNMTPAMSDGAVPVKTAHQQSNMAVSCWCCLLCLLPQSSCKYWV